MKKVRFTFRCEITVEGETYAAASNNFESIDLFSEEAKKKGIEFVEMCSVEDAETYEDISDKIEKIENSFRTYADTQIYLDLTEREGLEPLADEIALIRKMSQEHAVKEYNDEANGLYAFSIAGIDQSEDDTFANELVDALNELSEKTGAGACWYVGDEDEEYVFVE